MKAKPNKKSKSPKQGAVKLKDLKPKSNPKGGLISIDDPDGGGSGPLPP